MLIDTIVDPDTATPADVHRWYLSALAEIVSSVGVDAAADRTDLSRETLDSLVAGDAPDLTLEDAAAILALTDDWPNVETVRLEIRDAIMLGMSSAVLDVDALERELDLALDAKTIQQKIEGRRELSLEEYAAIALLIERENEYA